MKEPLFSICIPTIGRFDLVKMALKSLEKQTFQDFEIIIGDSHYNQDITQLVRRLNDPRIRVVHPPEDAGAFSPWDYPPRFARGAYIMWLDDDNCLLPFTLELFSDVVARTDADIITGNHLYYYDETHQKSHMRRRFGIVPFTGNEYTVDVKEMARRAFSFSRTGLKPEHPRFHPSATIISRRVIDSAYKRLGHVIFPDLDHMNSLQPILFSHARSCHFVDRPVAIIGRLGVSMGQTWSTSARKRYSGKISRQKLSPLTSYTKVNCNFECYLRVRKAVPDYFRDVPLNTAQFAKRHINELFVLDTTFRELIRDWRECLQFVAGLSEPARSHLLRKARVRAALSPFVFLSRRTRLNRLRRFIAGMLEDMREDIPRAVRAWNREFSVPLPRGAEYDTINGVVERAPALVKEITGRNITWTPKRLTIDH